MNLTFTSEVAMDPYYYIPDSVGTSRLVSDLEAAIEEDKLHPVEDRLEKFIQANIGDDRQVAFIISGGNWYYLKPIKENPNGWIVIAMEDKGP